MYTSTQKAIATLPNDIGERNGEQGYLLIGLLFLVALMTISMAIAAPKIAREIQRQKEIETIHRGEQYKRAIQLYYRKFGRYPMTLDQLKKTDNIRFLRQEYIDPMTGKKDWKLLHLGEVRMQAMGLFGQPLGGAAGGAVPGMPGSGLPPGAGSPASGLPGTMNGSSASGSDNFFNNSASSSATPNPAANAATTPDAQDVADNSTSDNSTGFGQSSSGMGGTPFGGSPTTMFANSGPNGASSPGTPSAGSPGLPGATSAPGSTGSGGMFGDSATGAPIVGVTVPLKKKSMISYRKKTVYDKWQFVYNPQEDVAHSTGMGGATPGTPAGNAPNGSPFGQGGNPSTAPFGSSSGGIGGSGIGGSGIGSSSGFGSSPSGSGAFDSSTGSSPTSSPDNNPPQ